MEDSEKKKMIQISQITTISMIVFWILFLYFSKLNALYAIVLLLPISHIIYQTYIKKSILLNIKDVEEEKKNILSNLEKDLDYAKVIPSILFGVGVLIPNKIKKIVLPYLLCALLFGTIIPFIMSEMNFKESTLGFLIVSEIIQYSLESFTYVLMIPVIYYALPIT
jgi:hypothetical protein